MTHIEPPFGPRSRRTSVGVRVGDGEKAVTIGGDAPVRHPVDDEHRHGRCHLGYRDSGQGSGASRFRTGAHHGQHAVEAAAAVPHVREQLDRMGVTVPLVGDFHYNGHLLLRDYPACAEALSKSTASTRATSG